MKENGSRMVQQKQCCLWRNGLAVKQKGKTNKQKRVTNNSDMHKFSHFPETYLVFDKNSEKLSYTLEATTVKFTVEISKDIKPSTGEGGGFDHFSQKFSCYCNLAY